MLSNMQIVKLSTLARDLDFELELTGMYIYVSDGMTNNKFDHSQSGYDMAIKMLQSIKHAMEHNNDKEWKWR